MKYPTYLQRTPCSVCGVRHQPGSKASLICASKGKNMMKATNTTSNHVADIPQLPGASSEMSREMAGFPNNVRTLKNLAYTLDDSGLDIYEDYMGSVYVSLTRGDYYYALEQMDDLENSLREAGSKAHWTSPEYEEEHKRAIQDVHSSSGEEHLDDVTVLVNDAMKMRHLIENNDDYGLDVAEDYGYLLIGSFIRGDMKSYNDHLNEMKTKLGG